MGGCFFAAKISDYKVATSKFYFKPILFFFLPSKFSRLATAIISMIEAEIDR